MNKWNDSVVASAITRLHSCRLSRVGPCQGHAVLEDVQHAGRHLAFLFKPSQPKFMSLSWILAPRGFVVFYNEKKNISAIL